MDFFNSAFQEAENYQYHQQQNVQQQQHQQHQQQQHQQQQFSTQSYYYQQGEGEEVFPTGPADYREEGEEGNVLPGQEDIDGPGRGRELSQEVIEFRRGLFGSSGDEKIAAGLREALSTCLEKTIALIGKQDGFFGNSAIKILIPEKLQKVSNVLRGFGLGPKIDEFETSLNRAAERAAPASREVVKKAVLGLSFDDVKMIWNGKNLQGASTPSAIADYFEQKIGGDLLTAFSPIVDQAMEETTVTRQFTKLSSKSRDIPFVGEAFNLDINTYTKQKTIEGLFVVLKEEEVKIRKDPAARITDILKLMF